MTTPRKIQRYGWRKDLPDQRDHLWLETPEGKAALDLPLPVKKSLRDRMPAVYDQGQLGSCTANAWGAAFEYEMMAQGESGWTPSRLFIYYEERIIEGSVDQDSGAEIRDGVKVLASKGTPPETDWPYNIDQFAVKPPQQAYDDAVKHEAVKYARVYPNGGLRRAIAADKPFVFGFTVYESFESDQVTQTGIIPMPGPDEQVLGGHAVACVGYDAEKRLLECRNSWGPDWGDSGYFWMPWAYYTMSPDSLASDGWALKVVS